MSTMNDIASWRTFPLSKYPPTDRFVRTTKCKSFDLRNILLRQKKVEVHEENCGLGWCGYFRPLGCPPTDHQRHSNFARSNRGIVLSIATIYPIKTTKKMGVPDVLPARRFPLQSSVVHVL